MVTVYGRTGLTERADGSPAEEFPDSSADVGKTILVCKCGHARSTDDTFKLLLTLPLLLRVCNHGEHKPDHYGSSLKPMGNQNPPQYRYSQFPLLQHYPKQA